jgi:methylated-DNA-protein-cysteine methyltransferase-like protein
VATYGQIAEMARASGPRQVGYALHALSDRDVPWHRIVNARGEISLESGLGGGGLQRALLAAEGVPFDARGRIDLGLFQWAPTVRRARVSTRPVRARGKRRSRR